MNKKGVTCCPKIGEHIKICKLEREVWKKDKTIAETTALLMFKRMGRFLGGARGRRIDFQKNAKGKVKFGGVELINSYLMNRKKQELILWSF